MIFRLAIIALTVFIIESSLGLAYGDTKQDKTSEVKKLYEIQKDYLNSKTRNNWEKIYSFQHPTFRKNISLPEFKFFNGYVTRDYRKEPSAHISGGYKVPSMDYILSHQDKKDILGFPAFRRYPMTTNAFININEASIDKILLSNNGKYAKSIMTYKGIETMSPSLMRAILKHPISLTMEDYWEKIDDQWFITVLKNPINLSGNVFFHFTPNNISTWESTEFTEFNSPDLDFGSVVIQVKK
jgi:hypothetical protein